MNKNENIGFNNNNNITIKKLKFNLNKSIQVTKIFARENHQLTNNESIFTMVNSDNTGDNQSIDRYVK